MVNCLQRIGIKNIKGTDNLEIKFDDLVANRANIVVAPNGFGKSTIAIAFKAAESGRLKLNKKDYFDSDESKEPELEIQLLGEKAGTYKSNNKLGEISRNISVCTINSSLVAKSTSRNFSGRTVSSADLRLESIVIFEKIPVKTEVEYSYTNMRKKYKVSIPNITKSLKDFEFIRLLYGNIDLFGKRKLETVSNKIETVSKEFNKKNSNQSSLIDNFIATPQLLEISNILEEYNSSWTSTERVFVMLQIFTILDEYEVKNNSKIIEETYNYYEYKNTRKNIDDRIRLFDITQFSYKTKIQKGKLVIEFKRASSMSNGERDVLSFISNLSKFEIKFNKKVGILIIDEVFDYLDGGNILAVQYFLSELIDKCKKNGQVLYPIIMTHLDPDSFTNYYFSKMKVHYISINSKQNLDDPIIKILRLRENHSLTDNDKRFLERYFLHFNRTEEYISVQLKNISGLPLDFKKSNIDIRNEIYKEVIDNYLNDSEYSSIKVVLALRLKIEENLCSSLSEENYCEFIETHTVRKKLKYIEGKGIEIPELYYLLQPLYNDGLHLRGEDNQVMNKLKASYLKTNNKVIQNMVKRVFEQ